MSAVDYTSLAKQYGSPYYLFDFDKVIERVHTIQAHLPSNATLCYAIKANAFLLNALKDENLLFEVCSPGELSICEKLGVDPQKIVFSGVVKTQQDVTRAYKLGVHTITLESVTHCKYLLQAVQEGPVHPQKVIIRLTSGNQFGMSTEDVQKCITLLKEVPSVTIRGIHYFTGTQKKIKKITEEIAFINQYCTDLQSSAGISFTDIEYGPGFSYDYFAQTDQSTNFDDLDAFTTLIKESPYHYVIELGRFIASPCGSYVTSIVDVKHDDKNSYVLIDGGINHINYYGQMMGMKNPDVVHVTQTTTDDKQNYTIAGSLCTTADIVLRQLPLRKPTIGDLLVFNNIGAYSITEGIYLFLSHALPAVLCKQNGTITQLRKSFETYIINA